MKALFKSPFVRSCLKFSGSIKLAMLLLAVLIVASIAGTLVESKFDTGVAQQYVYDAPWFIAWLVLLCVNLIGAVLVRYPWKPHQIGFVITHAGIVVMLVGAIIGRVWGFEGSITLFKNQQPVDYLLTGLQTFEARAQGMSEAKARTLNLNRTYPTEARPEIIKLNNLEIAAVGFAPELGLKSRIEKSDTGRPALRLIMTSAMSPKPVERWLLLDDSRNGVVNLGPTVVRYVTEPAVEEIETVESAKNPNLRPSRELHFAFAKIPHMNTARPLIGPATGMKTSFEFPAEQTGENFKGILNLFIDDETFSFPLNDVLGREVVIEGTQLKLKVSDYFADFRMNGNRPASISDQPNNPAVLFEIIGPPVTETAAAQCAHHQSGSCAHGDMHSGCAHAADGCSHGDDPHGHQHHNHNHGTSKPATELVIYRSAEGRLHFAGSTRAKETRGGITIGEEFSPGFADWICRVEETIEQAVVRQEIAPMSDESIRSINASGLLVRLSKAGQSKTEWIRMGQVTPLEFAGEKLDIMFGHKLHPLKFTVQLEKFEVEMNEGTQTPGSFKSFVKFHDEKKETTLTRSVWMNNPANFPEFAGAGLLGTTYKFSQSSWNPKNLNETTLQVIRDPGWSFKWIGSLMLCAGLFTMFYLKPYPQFAKAKRVAQASRESITPVTGPKISPAPLPSPAPGAAEVLVGK